MRRRPLAITLVGGVLLLTSPRPMQSLAVITGPSGSADPSEPVVAAVSLAAQLLVGWLLLVCLMVAAARVPGAAGRCCAVAARVTAPRAVRRTVELALGLSVVVGAVAVPVASASAATAAERPPSVSVTADGASGGLIVPNLDWAPAVPAQAHAPAAPPLARASAAPAVPEAAPPATVPATAPEPAGVVVRPGDTLWHLADASLRAAGEPAPSDHRIAQAWPQWWAANRQVIGDDPDLLLPGTTLQPPG